MCIIILVSENEQKRGTQKRYIRPLYITIIYNTVIIVTWKIYGKNHRIYNEENTKEETLW